MTFTTRGRTVEVKVKGQKFDAMQHPRDRFGRFIETGAEVRIVGGFLGRVVKNVGGGNIEVRRSDGKDVIVNRGHLTVISRPDGGKPTETPDDTLQPAPVQVASPEAVHVDADGNTPEERGDVQATPNGRFTVGQRVEVQVTDFAAPGQPKVWRGGTVTRITPQGNLHDVSVTDDDGTILPTQRVGPRGGNNAIRAVDAPAPGRSPGTAGQALLNEIAGMSESDIDRILDSVGGMRTPEEQARTAGRAAYDADEPRAPGANSVVQSLIGDVPVGDPRTTAIMQAFTDGYQSRADEEAASLLAEAPGKPNRLGQVAISAQVAADLTADGHDPANEATPRIRGGQDVNDPNQFDLFADAAPEPTDEEVQQAADADDPPVFDFQPEAKAPAPEEPHEEEPVETVYDLRGDALNTAIASIDTANRRAERAGIEDRFTYTVETYKNRIPATEPGMPDEVEVRHRLTLNRPEVSHDGWTFAATLTWDPEAGLVTRTVPGATLFSRPEARHCDVCNSQRDRRDTYVVQNGDQQKQVGSNCLQQFMGIRPAGLWMLGFEPDTGGGGEGGDGLGQVSFNDRRFDSQQTLALAFAVARDQGWISRGNAQATERRATADRVADVLTGSLPSREPALSEEKAWQEKMRAEAVGLMDDAQSILDTARTMDGDNDYVTNLRSVAQPDTVSGRNMPLLASAIAVHQRIQEQEAARRAAAEAQTESPSQHVGAKGDKIKDVETTVLGVRYIDGAYGVTTLITFADGDGNVYKWFASGRKDDIATGDKVTIAGTVKDHGEFRGVKETVLTRAKYKGTAGTDTGDRLTAERDAAAAAQAEQRAQEAAYEAYENDPLGSGAFVKVDDPSTIPIGTMIRWKVEGNYGTSYRNGYIVSGREEAPDSDLSYVRAHPVNHTRDGRDVVVGGGTSGYQVPLDSITGIAKDQDHTTGTELADSYFDRARVPGGFTEVHDGSASLAQIGAGTTVRIRGGGFDQYLNVTVLDRSGDQFTVRYPDGHTDTISADTIRSAALTR